MPKSRPPVLLAVGCLATGFVTSSFWGGFVQNQGSPGFGDRMVAGLIWIVLSAAKLGRLTTDPARSQVYNVWPLALVIAAVLFGVLVWLRRRKATAQARAGSAR